MINDMKLGLKSLKYSYGIKMNVILMIVFLGMAVGFYAIEGKADIGFFGDYMLICTALMPIQMLYSLSASNMVASSPVKKRLQTSVPAVISAGGMVAVYLFMAAFRGIMTWGQPERRLEMSIELLGAALIMVLMLIYMGIAYKFFYISLITVIAVVVLLSPTMGRKGYLELFDHIPLQWLQGEWGLAAALAAGLGMIAAAGFIQYLLNLLFYRYPLSKMAQSAPLRREM